MTTYWTEIKPHDHVKFPPDDPGRLLPGTQATVTETHIEDGAPMLTLRDDQGRTSRRRPWNVIPVKRS